MRAGGHADSHANAGVMPAVAFQPRFVRNDRGGPSDIAYPLTAEAGRTGKGDSAQCVAFALRSDAGRAGEAKTPSPDAEGRMRLRDPGFNYCENYAPTLDSSSPHTVSHDWAVRRLTPLECERLQGFPDGYTAIPKAADGPRYKALGNSMAVNVMRWIGRRIAMVEAA